MRLCPVLDKVNPLPGSEQHLARRHRDMQRDARQHGLHMRRHVVRALDRRAPSGASSGASRSSAVTRSRCTSGSAFSWITSDAEVCRRKRNSAPSPALASDRKRAASRGDVGEAFAARLDREFGGDGDLPLDGRDRCQAGRSRCASKPVLQVLLQIMRRLDHALPDLLHEGHHAIDVGLARQLELGFAFGQRRLRLDRLAAASYRAPAIPSSAPHCRSAAARSRSRAPGARRESSRRPSRGSCAMHSETCPVRLSSRRKPSSTLWKLKRPCSVSAGEFCADAPERRQSPASASSTTKRPRTMSTSCRPAAALIWRSRRIISMPVWPRGVRCAYWSVSRRPDAVRGMALNTLIFMHFSSACIAA